MSDLSAFAEHIWIVGGPNVRDMGVMFTTRMTVVKLCNGSLWVDSPVSVPSETLKRITELAPVRYLVAATPRQVANLACLERLGFAIRVGKSRDPSAKVQSAIQKLMNDEDARAKATAFAKAIAHWDRPRTAAETLLERYGGSV